uniref:Uncharacterized protein n=1 Tax=viral metagenome TaxID=1070528 RepID=A0A6C0BW92_9ZZZZ
MSREFKKLFSTQKKIKIRECPHMELDPILSGLFAFYEI